MIWCNMSLSLLLFDAAPAQFFRRCDMMMMMKAHQRRGMRSKIGFASFSTQGGELGDLASVLQIWLCKLAAFYLISAHCAFSGLMGGGGGIYSKDGKARLWRDKCTLSLKVQLSFISHCDFFSCHDDNLGDEKHLSPRYLRRSPIIESLVIRPI